MSDPREDQEVPAKRGDALWQETKHGIAARNQQAQKEGRARRQAHEARAAARLRAAELHERAGLADGSGPA